MKNAIINHKKLSCSICFFITFALVLFMFSHAVYHRSVVATIVEMVMVAIDREKIYAEGPDYDLNLQSKMMRGMGFCEKPEGVDMDIPYYDTFEHGMQVFHFNEDTLTDTVIIYYHGGAYINEPIKYHWNIINQISQGTQCPVIMPIYPKVPNATCEDAYEAVMNFYLDVVANNDIKNVVFIGDSSGGAMALVMAQLIRDEHPEVLQPIELMLLSPWMDVSMENEDIEEIDRIDPMLDAYGLKDLGERWAGDRDVHDPMVSPIYGSFEDLGHISIFIGTRDILYPDDLKFSQMLTEQGIDHLYVQEEGLNHPYALFPIPEAKEAKTLMIEMILGI